MTAGSPIKVVPEEGENGAKKDGYLGVKKDNFRGVNKNAKLEKKCDKNAIL